MTLTFPSYRNNFHPAWLLLPAPPLIGFLIGTTTIDPSLSLRVLLAASLALPVLCLRVAAVSGRTQRLLKELRTQLPGCLVAMLLPGMLAWAESAEMTEWILVAYGFGCLLMGASAFGSEFEHGTISGLLTQPLPRATLFLEKVSVLGILLLVATFNVWLALDRVPNYGPDQPRILLATLLPLVAFCSAPLYSLISRSTLAGVVFATAIPIGLFATFSLGLEAASRLGSQTPAMLNLESNLISWSIPVYLLFTLLAGWRVFSRYQVPGGGAGGRSSSGMHPLSLPMDRILQRLLPPTNGTARLIRKELRLHVVPWLVAGITVGLWLLAMALKQFITDENLRNTVCDLAIWANGFGLLGTIALLTAGAACVAEERQLGTLEWQLTQPLQINHQWWIKVAVTTAIAVSLGFLLPATLIWVSFDAAHLRLMFGGTTALGAGAYSLFFTLLLVVSIYASSVARSTMKAMATAAFIAAGLAGLIALLLLTGGAWIDEKMTRHIEQLPAGVNAPAWAPTVETLVQLAAGAAGITGILIAGGFLAFAGQNFRRLSIPAGIISRQLMTIGVGLTLWLGALGLITSQMALLRVQANQAESYARERASAIAAVGQELRLGRLTTEIATPLGVPTNATPEAVVDAVAAREGRQALTRIAERFHPKRPADGHSPAFIMDPALRKRYGITPATPRP